MLRAEAPRPMTKKSKKNCKSLKGKGLEGVVRNTAGSFPSSNLDCMVFAHLFSLYQSNLGSHQPCSFTHNNQISQTPYTHQKPHFLNQIKTNVSQNSNLYHMEHPSFFLGRTNHTPFQITDQNTKLSTR